MANSAVFLFFALFLLPAWTHAELRVATYNLKNYNPIDRMVDGVWSREYPKPEQEKAALRQSIISVNPDVIALQEIGSMEYLEELRRDLANEGLLYPYYAHLLALDEGRCLAVLSKRLISEVQQHDSLTFTVGGQLKRVRRGLLEINLSVRDQQLTLYVVHLKSRRTEDPEDPDAQRARVGEAQRIRDYIRKRHNLEEDLFLVAGDINDTPDSAAFQRLLVAGDDIISVDLKPADSRGETWTYHHLASETYQRIDAILASRALIEAARGGLNCHIYDGDGSVEASDHRMLFVDLPL